MLIFFASCLVNGKSLESPETSHSSSPESSTEPFFSFDNSVLSHTSALISPHANHSLVHETTIPGRRPPVVETALPPPNDLTPYFNGEDSPRAMENTPLESLWESRENFQHLNRTYNPSLPCPYRQVSVYERPKRTPHANTSVSVCFKRS